MCRAWCDRVFQSGCPLCCESVGGSVWHCLSLCKPGSDSWSPDERRLFLASMAEHDKDFFLVQKVVRFAANSHIAWRVRKVIWEKFYHDKLKFNYSLPCWRFRGLLSTYEYSKPLNIASLKNRAFDHSWATLSYRFSYRGFNFNQLWFFSWAVMVVSHLFVVSLKHCY